MEEEHEGSWKGGVKEGTKDKVRERHGRDTGETREEKESGLEEKVRERGVYLGPCLFFLSPISFTLFLLLHSCSLFPLPLRHFLFSLPLLFLSLCLSK